MSSTLLGVVGAVSGSSVSVVLAESVSSGISIIGGRSYRIGQVGSFVRIPQGYHDLYGIIADVGATATPKALAGEDPRGQRWMGVQLVGEIVEVSFERGISQYPNVNDEVHLVTEEDLTKIYGLQDDGQVVVGRLANAESVPVRLDLNKLLTRHSAVLGSTGSGKSTTVSSLLRSITTQYSVSQNPSARILLIDIHGEYAKALNDHAAVFKVLPADNEKQLFIPYWALSPSDVLSFTMGRLEDKAGIAILDKILRLKLEAASKTKPLGVDINSTTIESPLPYCLRRLWYELIDPEIKTWDDKERTKPALISNGDAASLTEPVYKPASPYNTVPFINSANVLSIRRQLGSLKSRLLDRQYEFLLKPGAWCPNCDGEIECDLPELLESWIGHDKSITILDLSGVPSDVLLRLIGAILSIIYEALFWGRNRVEGGRQRPQLIVMEEAHRYLGKEAENPARMMVQRIVKEGRKFGVGAMIVSQRPSEIDDTILSQCGTFIALRLSNSADRARVQAALPDNLSGIADALSVLRTGEAVIAGEAAKLPVRCRISLPAEGKRPDSEDPAVHECWRKQRSKEDYKALVATWRSQNPKWNPT